jgi:hypothetical protein
MKTKFNFKRDVKCEAFTFRHGLYRYLGNDKHSEFGYTIELNNVDSKTYIQLEDFDEAVETCMNHYNRFDKVKELAEARIKYLSSDEGAWGRSGT